jgi:hypothetical protein
MVASPELAANKKREAGRTLICDEPLKPPYIAEMLLLPVDDAATNPVELTLATDPVLEFQFAVWVTSIVEASV